MAKAVQGRNGLKCLLLALTMGLLIHAAKAGEHKTLPIGSPAPDFNLPGLDGKIVSLSTFKNARILVIIFTCNHCPTAQAYEDRIIRLTSDYASKNVAVLAIMPNDPQSLRLDELDFSDLGDSYDEMKIRAQEKKFNFPYLYDGDTQEVAEAYGPVATPHVFIFDEARTLRYTGRFDDMESPYKTPRNQDARNAIDALLNKKEVEVKTTKVFGCSIKWKEKRESVAKAFAKWAKEPVNVENIDQPGLISMIKDTTAKLRLINFWRLDCTACEKSFPEFVTINRMYRDRDFEFISVNLDGESNKEKVLSFLQIQQASNRNYLTISPFKKGERSSVDPHWDGKLPFTLLIEPGGKIVYTRQGAIDAALLKKTIVENHLIGRYP